MPGLDTSTGTPTIRLGQRTPAVTTLWLADYATPDPTSPVDPDRPAPPDGGVRVRLDLFSLDSKGLADGAVLPAASDSGARLRSSALIETHDSLHGEYLDVTGQVELVKAGERVCGTFRIGDDDEWAQGSFDVEAPR